MSAQHQSGVSQQGRAQEADPAQLARELEIPLLSARLLARLGITDKQKAHDFLYPRLATLPTPWLMRGMKKGVALVLAARAKNIPVTIFGDYDADGICATVLLVTFLKTLNMTAGWYIPDRLTEGYGLSRPAVATLIASIKKPGLIIHG